MNAYMSKCQLPSRSSVVKNSLFRQFIAPVQHGIRLLILLFFGYIFSLDIFFFVL